MSTRTERRHRGQKVKHSRETEAHLRGVDPGSFRASKGEIRNRERGPWGRGEQAPWGGERCNTAFGVKPAGFGAAGGVKKKKLPGGRYSTDRCLASELLASGMNFNLAGMSGVR